MSDVTELHQAVKHGDVTAMKALLSTNRGLANSRSEQTDVAPIRFMLPPNSVSPKLLKFYWTMVQMYRFWILKMTLLLLAGQPSLGGPKL